MEVNIRCNAKSGTPTERNKIVFFIALKSTDSRMHSTDSRASSTTKRINKYPNAYPAGEGKRTNRNTSNSDGQ